MKVGTTSKSTGFTGPLCGMGGRTWPGAPQREWETIWSIYPCSSSCKLSLINPRSFNSHSYQVQHALKAWTTGEYVEARGIANHFSADNYGDRTERKSDKGRTVNVLLRRATQYMPMVKALSKDHWNAIFTEISNILADNKPKRKRSQSASSHGSEAPD